MRTRLQVGGLTRLTSSCRSVRMETARELRHGESWTRDEIAARFGGNAEWYLPMRGGDVVCACIDPALNPQAPQIVLPAPGVIRQKSARRLLAQGNAVPLFLKRAPGDWRYAGRWRAVSRSDAERDILAHRGARRDVACVLWLEEVW